jgi:hypothetical protein
LWANDTYAINLKKKDHDIADAIAICHFGFLQKTNQPTPSLSIEDVLLLK